MQMRPIVYKTSAGLKNLNKKTKTKRILVVVVKCRHRENGVVGTLRSDDGGGNENVI